MSLLIKLRNKNCFAKVWHNRKNIQTFAQQKIFKVRYMLQHIKTTNRFSPIGDYTVRGACFAIR